MWDRLKIQSNLSAAPCEQSLLRGMIKLHMTSMLQHRAHYHSSRPAFRYLAYDASPQHGAEQFGTVERIIFAKGLERHMGSNDEFAQLAVTQRKLAICQLGQSRLGAAEKGVTLMHQTWLEYGASLKEVRLANWDVRSCLSDMGTELTIVDMADITGHCFPGMRQPQLATPAASNEQWLFPNALCIPG